MEVDESAMTGESLPVTLNERQMAKMGGTIARGETEATVVYTGKDTQAEFSIFPFLRIGLSSLSSARQLPCLEVTSRALLKKI